MSVLLKWIYSILLISAFLSCNDHKQQKKELLDKNEKAIQEIAAKYQAIANWDSVSLYSFHYQEMFIEKNKPMLFEGRIYDIEKKDSNYIIKVLDEKENVPKHYLAFITFTPQQFSVIYSGNKSTRGIFVIQVSKVSSSNPLIKEEEEQDEEDQSYTYTHLSDDDDQMITIFRGKLVDFHLDEIKKAND